MEEVIVGCTGELVKGRERREALAQGEEQIGRRGPGSGVRMERAERGEKMEDRALWGTLWCVGVGIVSEMATPLLGRGGEWPKEGSLNGSSSQCHVEAEEELEGTQDRDGRWWETEWRGPGRVRQVRARRRVTAERRVGRSLPAMVEPHLHSP